MPVGTRGSVKGILPEQLRALGTEIVLANTYHLHLRPGEDVVAELGGLHRFMGWSGPILTDSGGYQVFSLSAKVDEDGVSLPSVVDGSAVRLTPESAIAIQHKLGADVIMAFDHCPADPTDRAAVEDAVQRTHRWLDRCVRAHAEHGNPSIALFGIVQGGAFDDLRARSVEAVTRHDLPGYAIGGVSVGEGRAELVQAVASTARRLPADRPRYLMGVGTPRDFLEAIEQGVDLFDCVTPTRHGRTHQVFTSSGTMNLRNASHARDSRPIEEGCDCSACRSFSRGYLRHLANSNEMLAAILLTLHNLRFFQRLLEQARKAIAEGTFPLLRDRYCANPV
jgi:queuine tRNA-ribosyltransferase